MSNIIYKLNLKKKKTNIASLLLSLIYSWETYYSEFEVTNKR